MVGLKKILIVCTVAICTLSACRPVPQPTSIVYINADRPTQPVNKNLYGITLEEVNHAIEGGIYGELIRNGSFEDGFVPPGCLYDANTISLITPAGWMVPFVPSNVVPGWRPLSNHTQLRFENSGTIGEHNTRTLGVLLGYPGVEGGVIGEGFGGFGIKKGEAFEVSFFVRGGLYDQVVVSLRDSTGAQLLSDTTSVQPDYRWQFVKKILTANEDCHNATLVFSANKGLWFFIDRVSLFSVNATLNQKNMFRNDLFDAIADLKPAFVRFQGGASTEGYALGAVTDWVQTLDNKYDRPHSWSIWGYGTANGMGLHEYLLLAEQLNAKPVLVVNAGMVNQRYRLRYETIDHMDKWSNKMLAYLDYANGDLNTELGKRRADNGHPPPFQIAQISIGSENKGTLYKHRYLHLRKQLKKKYPTISLIASDSAAVKGFRFDWIDTHLLTNTDLMIGLQHHFDVAERFMRAPQMFIGEFGTSLSAEAGTLRAAVGEAAFLLGLERNPFHVKGVAYYPLLGNAKLPLHGYPAILFDGGRVAKSPSYHVLQMFSTHRGDEVLETHVETFSKPLVKAGGVYVVQYAQPDGGRNIDTVRISTSGMNPVTQTVVPIFATDKRTAIRWTQPLTITNDAYKNHVVAGGESRDTLYLQKKWRVEQMEATSAIQPLTPDDVTAFATISNALQLNFTLETKFKIEQPNQPLTFHLRDNGLVEELADGITVKITDNGAQILYKFGRLEQPISTNLSYTWTSGQWYPITINCHNETVTCTIHDGGQPLTLQASLPLLPTVTAAATVDKLNNQLILKITNNSLHIEQVLIKVDGIDFNHNARVICLTGKPEAKNTLEQPDNIIPVQKNISLSSTKPVYQAPPSSVSILILDIR